MAIQSVPIGHMRLYSHVRPGLQAGVYAVELDQNFVPTEDTAADADVGTVGGVTKHIEVTAPRFGLPATEVHSVFPPHNSQGPFQDTLPHIALKRRTLPWERSGSGSDSTRPWLALILLSDGEGTFYRNMSVKDVLPARMHGDVPDGAVCDAIEVTDTTIKKVFPAQDELPYLFHVRQVNVNDTENAGNDEDGFMAVVMANRLPRAGSNYGAYLISIEDRIADLEPNGGTPTQDIGDAGLYNVALSDLAQYQYSTGAATSRVNLTSSNQPARRTAPGTPRSSVTSRLTSTAAAATETRGNAWQAPTQQARSQGEGGLASSAAYSATTLITDVDLVALEESVLGVTPTLIRFPVLAHWQFTCTGDKDFRSLMLNLDVAMLGSQPAAGVSPNPPKVTNTGHVLIDSTTRSGERVPAWYRGPFTPRQVRRRERRVPFHSADQARTLGGDFIENLGEAAAFEIGRMLALADPSFLQELLRWRRDGFRRLKTATQMTDAGLGMLVNGDGLALAAGRKLRVDLMVGLAQEELAGLGPRVDPTFGLDLRDDDPGVIAAGLGTPVERVRSALGIGRELTVPGLKPGTSPEASTTSFDDLVAAGDAQLGHLRSELDRRIEGIAADANPEKVRRGDG